LSLNRTLSSEASSNVMREDCDTADDMWRLAKQGAADQDSFWFGGTLERFSPALFCSK